MKMLLKIITVIILSLIFYLLGYNTEKPNEALYQKVIETPIFFDFIRDAPSLDDVYLIDDDDDYLVITKEWQLSEIRTLIARYHDNGKSSLMYHDSLPTQYWLEIDCNDLGSFSDIFFNGPSENQIIILNHSLDKALKEKIVYSCKTQDIKLNGITALEH